MTTFRHGSRFIHLLGSHRTRLLAAVAGAICAAHAPGRMWAQTTWSTGTNTIYESGSKLGIGTSSPAALLDVAGSSYKLSNASAEVELAVGFAKGVANKNVDLYMTGTQAFTGVIDIDVIDSYAYQNSMGVLHKRYYLGLAAFNAVYMNQARVMDEGGTTADNYALSDLSWDATNSRYKITLVHRVSTGSAPVIRLTAFGYNWHPGLWQIFSLLQPDRCIPRTQQCFPGPTSSSTITWGSERQAQITCSRLVLTAAVITTLFPYPAMCACLLIPRALLTCRRATPTPRKA